MFTTTPLSMGVPTSISRLRDDTRAIEGLPIRLVIALIVGVASLSVMMGMISGLGTLGVTEVDVEPDPEVVTAGEQQTVTFTVVDPDRSPVADATVVLKGDSAQLADGIRTGQTNADGVVEFTIDPDLHPNQRQGTLSVDIKPPSGGNYADQRDNTELLVVAQ